MKKFISILSLMLCLVLVFPLAACDDILFLEGDIDTESSEVSTEKTEASSDVSTLADTTDSFSDEAPSPAYQKYNGNGDDVYILTASIKNSDVLADKNESSVLQSAMQERDTFINRTLGLKIRYAPFESDNISNIAILSFLSGSHDYNIICSPRDTAALLTVSNVFENLTDNGLGVAAQYFDADADYWNQNYISAASRYGKIFTVAGDANLNLYRSAYAVFFNRQFLDQYDINSDLHKLVANGDWTLEEFVELAKYAYVDTKGDGIDSNDIFGIAANNKTLLLSTFLTASRADFTVQTAQATTFNTQSERVFDAIDKIKYLLSDSTCSYITDYTTNSLFTNGNAMFTVDSFGRALSTFPTDFDFGILPLPKYDIIQNNYATASYGNYEVFGVMNELDSDKKTTAIVVLEAMSHQSQTMLEKAFTRLTPTNDSALMLELIFDSLYFELTVIYLLDVRKDICSQIARSDYGGAASTFEKFKVPTTEKIKEIESFFSNAE